MNDAAGRGPTATHAGPGRERTCSLTVASVPLSSEESAHSPDSAPPAASESEGDSRMCQATPHKDDKKFGVNLRKLQSSMQFQTVPRQKKRRPAPAARPRPAPGASSLVAVSQLLKTRERRGERAARLRQTRRRTDVQEVRYHVKTHHVNGQVALLKYMNLYSHLFKCAPITL